MSERWREHQRHCKHFTGLLDPPCQAGILYATFPPGSLPCIPGYNTGGGRCGCFEVMTDQEAQDYEAVIQKTALGMLTGLLSGNCPTCGAKVETEEKVGRSVYARPCGHRLYQGKPGAFRRAKESGIYDEGTE